MASPRSKLDEIVAAFATFEDPRSEINRRHPLPSVLVIAVLAVLAGAAGPTAIARWARYKEELLKSLLDLPHGVPGKDVFRRVLMTLKPEAFEAGFNAWIAHLRDEAVAVTGVERPIIAVDGKTARRSHDAAHGLGALHVVTAWAGEYGLALGQELRAEKSNEIAAIPGLLKKIDIRGGIVTIDAIGAQKAIAEEVLRGKADYVLALKRNQESLHREVVAYIDEQPEGELEAAWELTAISTPISPGGRPSTSGRTGGQDHPRLSATSTSTVTIGEPTGRRGRLPTGSASTSSPGSSTSRPPTASAGTATSCCSRRAATTSP